MHPNQSIDSEAESFTYSIGEELIGDNEFSKEDHDNNLFNKIQTLDRSYTTNYKGGTQVTGMRPST